MAVCQTDVPLRLIVVITIPAMVSKAVILFRVSGALLFSVMTKTRVTVRKLVMKPLARASTAPPWIVVMAMNATVLKRVIHKRVNVKLAPCDNVMI